MQKHVKNPNMHEESFYQLATKNGWTATKRGWPDFLCFGPDGEIIAVEVKPRLVNDPTKFRMLKPDQVNTLDQLSAHGIRCFVSDGLKLEPYDRERHAPEARRAPRTRNR